MRKVYQPESSKFRTCLNAVPVHQKILDGVNVVKVTRVRVMVDGPTYTVYNSIRIFTNDYGICSL